MYEKNEVLQDLMEKVRKENSEFQWIRDVKIICLTTDKTKTENGCTCYADCTKVSDKMKAIANCDFVITFYEDSHDLSPEIQYRLMFHELMHVGYDPDAEKFFIIPHDLEDFRAVIDKWGVDWIRE